MSSMRNLVQPSKSSHIRVRTAKRWRCLFWWKKGWGDWEIVPEGWILKCREKWLQSGAENCKEADIHSQGDTSWSRQFVRNGKECAKKRIEVEGKSIGQGNKKRRREGLKRKRRSQTGIRKIRSKHQLLWFLTQLEAASRKIQKRYVRILRKWLGWGFLLWREPAKLSNTWPSPSHWGKRGVEEKTAFLARQGVEIVRKVGLDIEWGVKRAGGLEKWWSMRVRQLTMGSREGWSMKLAKGKKMKAMPINWKMPQNSVEHHKKASLTTL